MNTNNILKVLILGDIVGSPGRRVVKQFLELYRTYVDLVIANVENTAHGFGITKSNLDELKSYGVNVFTGGNHTFDRKEIFDFIDQEELLIRPANFPFGTPGRGYTTIVVNNCQIGIINFLGRVFMEPLSSPFIMADEIVAQLSSVCKFILVDFHAEATAEKVAFAMYLDGRVTAVVGSHTHVQTADERILPKGTAFITDMGCCGATDGVIGMALPGVLRRMINQLPAKLDVANGQAQLCGVCVQLNMATGKACKITRIKFNEASLEADKLIIDQGLA